MLIYFICFYVLLFSRSVATAIGSRPREGHKTHSKSVEWMLLIKGVCTLRNQGDSSYGKQLVGAASELLTDKV